MKKFLYVLFALAVAGLVLGTGEAWSSQRDPDTTVDGANLISIVTHLLAPDVTIGDLDTTVAGTGNEVAGLGGSLTDPPADPADSDPGTTYFVDNTPADGDCPAAAYPTIQAAVNASGPGDTVKVCPGTYPEQVRIIGHNHDKLKLESLKPLQATIQWPTTETTPFVLVDMKMADGVTLRGFVMRGPFPACGSEGERHEGVLVENAFDEHIHHNHITMIESFVPAGRGCQGGDAVAIGRRSDPANPVTDLPASAHVDHNLIDEYQKNGIQAVNNGTFVDADHNEVTGSIQTQPHAASNGVVVFRQAAATIRQNVISNNQFTGSLALASSGGILLLGTPANSSRIDHNRIFGNDYGIDTELQDGLEISHNDVFQNRTDGIVLCGDIGQGCFGTVTQIIVRKNDVMSNGTVIGGSGIVLLGAGTNLLKSNHIENNGAIPDDTTDGIRVDSGSTNNEILDNHMLNNITHDCHDSSAGGGTAGTANTWKGDQGQTENRPGLCAKT
jgi:hypothetical protein